MKEPPPPPGLNGIAQDNWILTNYEHKAKLIKLWLCFFIKNSATQFVTLDTVHF